MSADTDGDGLGDRLRSSIIEPMTYEDTDRDGVDDNSEVIEGTDPNEMLNVLCDC